MRKAREPSACSCMAVSCVIAPGDALAAAWRSLHVLYAHGCEAVSIRALVGTGVHLHVPLLHIWKSDAGMSRPYTCFCCEWVCTCCLPAQLMLPNSHRRLCAGPTEGERPVARGAHGAFEHGGYMYIFGGICDDEVHSTM